MADYWIGDAVGRVLGPMAFEVLRDLVAFNRVRGITRVSRDGEIWVPVAEDPDLAPLVAAQEVQLRSARDQESAVNLRRTISELQRLMPHQIFGLAAEAPASDYRMGFFDLVRRCYPEPLRADADPDLRQALEDLVALLGRLMTYVEEKQRSAAEPVYPGRPPAAERAPEERAKPEGRPVEMRAGARSPSRLSEQLGPRRVPELVFQRGEDNAIRADVEINSDNYRIFTDSKVTNLSTGGAFIPSTDLVPMGTRVSMTFRFADAGKVVTVQGKVVFWSAGDKGQSRGFGVRFTNLGLTDQAFMTTYVKKLQTGRL
jgi:uncharacterized protein (TIGR02266 family)